MSRVDDNPFEYAMKFIAQWEWGNREDGGYTNDPTDPGGETKWGISKRAHPNLDIKNLTKEEAALIYQDEYWDGLRVDFTDWPLAIAAFDTAVNCGVSRANKWLKQCDEDLYLLLQLRTIHYLNIIKANPALNKYKRGWFNRVNDLKKYIDILKDVE